MTNFKKKYLNKNILWWGRFDRNYSRNRIIRHLMNELGYRIMDFHPRISSLGDIEASLKGIRKPDVIWVPCFRQRDIQAASRWARSRNVPLIFDPLISAWDKQVFERNKFDPDSKAAARLLRQETKQFHCANLLIADTAEHKNFFINTFKVDPALVKILHVGAEEPLFSPGQADVKTGNTVNVLFYGSFINLQGPQTIIDAASLCNNPSVHWQLLGKGPLLETCRALANGNSKINFEDWVEYENLPDRIRQADILLGVFGASDKAGRVIPNKVYQSLACARPVITRSSPAYPDEILHRELSGIYQIPADNPQALADAVSELASAPGTLRTQGVHARDSYEQFFSNNQIKRELQSILNMVIESN